MNEKNMMGKIAAAILLMLAFAAPDSAALPPMAPEFYGIVAIDGEEALPGTNITAHDSSGTICGRQTTDRQGEFGLLSCAGDDPQTGIDEGAVSGEMITIMVNRIPAYNTTWREGELHRIKLDAYAAEGETTQLSSTNIPMIAIIPGIAALLAAATVVYVKKGE